MSSSGKLVLLSFQGLAAPGPINVAGADTGDILISVTSITVGHFGLFTEFFMREVQFGGTLPFVVQTSASDLSAIVFVALVKKIDRDDD